MSATGKVLSDNGGYQYTVMPDLAIAATISGISVLKETFTVGQQVLVIQIGDGESSAAEFGFASLSANLKPVVAVTESIKPAVIAQSPASFAAAYIANKAGKFKRLYELAEIVAPYAADALTVKYTTGVNAGDTGWVLSPIGISRDAFFPGEIALIDAWQYGHDVIVGWWKMILEATLTITFAEEGSSSGLTYLAVLVVGVGVNYEYRPGFAPLALTGQHDLVLTAVAEPAVDFVVSFSGDIAGDSPYNLNFNKNYDIIMNYLRLPIHVFIRGNEFGDAAKNVDLFEVPDTIKEITFAARKTNIRIVSGTVDFAWWTGGNTSAHVLKNFELDLAAGWQSKLIDIPVEYFENEYPSALYMQVDFIVLSVSEAFPSDGCYFTIYSSLPSPFGKTVLQGGSDRWHSFGQCEIPSNRPFEMNFCPWQFAFSKWEGTRGHVGQTETADLYIPGTSSASADSKRTFTAVYIHAIPAF